MAVLKELVNRIIQQNVRLQQLNQAIAEKGLDGLDEEEKKLFQEFYLGPVSGTTQPTSRALAQRLRRLPLSAEDRSIAGKFVELVEQGRGRQPLGEVGVGAQRLIEGLGGKATMTSKTAAKLFNRALKIADQIRR